MPLSRLAVSGGIALGALAVIGAVVALATNRGTHRHDRSVRARLSADMRPRTLTITCFSPSLGGALPARVYLPARYRTIGPGYRVVYFLHGLPGGPRSYENNAFVAKTLAADHEPAIVVAPQGARRRNSDREYLDWSPTEDWPRAIAVDLTACIDRRFHTLATRRGRALVGLSAGGYGAMNIGLRNLDAFGAVESWSGYFVATDPSGHHVLKLPSAAARAAARVPHGAALADALRRWPALIAFYVGRGDDRFADVNEAFARSLAASHIRHVFRSYPGGHSPALWQTHAPRWLSMVLVALSSGRVRSP